MSFQVRLATLAAVLLISSTITGAAQDTSRAADPTETVRSMMQDPAIRDFVGIAENTWDFSKPGGVPGFEPQPSADPAR